MSGSHSAVDGNKNPYAKKAKSASSSGGGSEDMDKMGPQ